MAAGMRPKCSSSAVLEKDMHWNGTPDSVCSSWAGCHSDRSVGDVVNLLKVEVRTEPNSFYLALGQQSESTIQ